MLAPPEPGKKLRRLVGKLAWLPICGLAVAPPAPPVGLLPLLPVGPLGPLPGPAVAAFAFAVPGEAFELPLPPSLALLLRALFPLVAPAELGAELAARPSASSFSRFLLKRVSAMGRTYRWAQLALFGLPSNVAKRTHPGAVKVVVLAVYT